ncbi:MAG: ribonuclease J, partial [Candidatus Saccharimonas sp.]
QILVVCTGGQGEPGAALSRMAMNEHRVVKLRPADTVVISSTPIPGNERSYARIGDLLSLIGVKQYRHPTHEIDGSGPLHVSGHASRDEHAEMLRLTKPTYLMPIYGGALNRQYHKEIALHEGMHDKNIIMANNGAVIEIGVDKIIRLVGNVTAGAQLIDQTGALVPEIVTRDRLQLKSTGFVIVVVTIDRRGRLVSSVDILTRGYIFIKDNPGVIESLRVGVSRTVNSRKEVTSKTAIELLRWAILAVVTDSLLATTNNLPVIIPVINVVGITKVQSRPAEDVR